MQDHDKEIDLEGDGAPSGKSTALLVAQFFLIPLLIVIVGVGVFLLFGLITSEAKTARDYLNEIRSSTGNRRWQAAFNLSQALARDGGKNADRSLAPEMIKVFEEARRVDTAVRQFLALALGNLGDPRAIPSLIEALEDEDSQTKIYAMRSLGILKATEAVPALLELARSTDAGLRKMAVYVLGVLKDERAIPALKAALEDSADDVRWNAALALAQFGDRAGSQILIKMLDRSYLDRIESMRSEHKEEAIISAIKALAQLRERNAEPILAGLSRSDPSLKVRQAAIEALSEIKSPVR